MFKFSGKRPANLGVTNGKLAPPPHSPNCVSSQAPESDAQHYIAPLRFQGSPAEALAKLKSVLQGMPRTQLITETSIYLYAECSTPFMGFVDDVEFSLDEAAGVLHVRSASRLGYSDMGVNRKRVEAIRARFGA